MSFIVKPSGQPQVTGSKRYVKVNSTVTLICDTASVNGSITWYKWLFANGNELGNTTEKTWTYTAKSGEETLQFVCIAGNAAGQSENSSVIYIKVQSVGVYDCWLLYIFAHQGFLFHYSNLTIICRAMFR